MAVVRRILDPTNLPRLNEAEMGRLDAMTDHEITAAALSDPDNPPLNDAESARVMAVQAVRAARAGTGLSQARFAETFHINLARLRDLEQGRTQADSAMLAYLKVISREPEAVRRALAEPAPAGL